MMAATRPQDNDSSEKSADDYYNNRAKVVKNDELKPRPGPSSSGSSSSSSFTRSSGRPG